ncbi:MAG: hypothetical protein J6X86_00065 [Bacteroidales bacterium]|nr:hypothetical protein [Bacteroidales bacterium]
MSNTDTLKTKLEAINRAISNYEELDSDMENPEYVARGNGFCDSKYSEDFIEGQLEKLRNEKEKIEKELSETKE